MKSNFDFLRAEWPELADAAARAESIVLTDPRVSSFYARHALELTVAWLYKHDSVLKPPYRRLQQLANSVPRVYSSNINPYIVPPTA
jgi:hypothetical protein